MTYITNAAIQSMSGDTSRGGWQAVVNVANQSDSIAYGQEVELYVLSEGGGVWEEFNNKALRANAVVQTTTFDRKQSNTSISLRTSDMYLQNAGLQGIYFTDDSTPSNPHQIPDLNLAKIVKHILTEHTNITATNFSPEGWVDISQIDIDNSTSVSVYTVRQSNSIWSTLDKIASDEFNVRYFTRNDDFVYKQHPQFNDTPEAVVLDITADMIVAQPELTYRSDVKIEQVQLYALTDGGITLQSFYPSNVGTEVRRHKFSNLRCNDQSRLDTLAYRAFADMTREYDVRLTLAGAWGAYLELYDRVSLTYTGTTANGVSISWVDKKFWVDRVTVSLSGTKLATTELTLQEEYS